MWLAINNVKKNCLNCNKTLEQQATVRLYSSSNSNFSAHGVSESMLVQVRDKTPQTSLTSEKENRMKVTALLMALSAAAVVGLGQSVYAAPSSDGSIYFDTFDGNATGSGTSVMVTDDSSACFGQTDGGVFVNTVCAAGGGVAGSRHGQGQGERQG